VCVNLLENYKIVSLFFNQQNDKKFKEEEGVCENE